MSGSQYWSSIWEALRWSSESPTTWQPWLTSLETDDETTSSRPVLEQMHDCSSSWASPQLAEYFCALMA